MLTGIIQFTEGKGTKSQGKGKFAFSAWAETSIFILSCSTSLCVKGHFLAKEMGSSVSIWPWTPLPLSHISLSEACQHDKTLELPLKREAKAPPQRWQSFRMMQCSSGFSKYLKQMPSYYALSPVGYIGQGIESENRSGPVHHYS